MHSRWKFSNVCQTPPPPWVESCQAITKSCEEVTTIWHFWHLKYLRPCPSRCLVESTGPETMHPWVSGPVLVNGRRATHGSQETVGSPQETTAAQHVYVICCSLLEYRDLSFYFFFWSRVRTCGIGHIEGGIRDNRAPAHKPAVTGVGGTLSLPRFNRDKGEREARGGVEGLWPINRPGKLPESWMSVRDAIKARSDLSRPHGRGVESRTPVAKQQPGNQATRQRGGGPLVCEIPPTRVKRGGIGCEAAKCDERCPKSRNRGGRTGGGMASRWLTEPWHGVGWRWAGPVFFRCFFPVASLPLLGWPGICTRPRGRLSSRTANQRGRRGRDCTLFAGRPHLRNKAGRWVGEIHGGWRDSVPRGPRTHVAALPGRIRARQRHGGRW